MDNFFSQLIARHQGLVSTVQPLMPSPFEAAPALIEPQIAWAGAATSPFVPEAIADKPELSEPATFNAADSQLPSSESASVRLRPLQMPPPKALSSSLQSETLPTAAEPIESPAPSPLSSSLAPPPSATSPPISTVSVRAQPTSTRTRLETVTRWIKQTAPASASQSAGPLAAEAHILLTSPATVQTVPLAEAPSQTPPDVLDFLPEAPTSLMPVLKAAPVPLPPSPTVQIAIGRIEIRASAPPATSPPPPPARPLQRQPALSLEQYLQQHNRRT